jgi:hypothetical protein
MIYLIEYKVKRISQTNCCRRVYYSILTEEVQADSEQQAIEKIEKRPNIVYAKIKA